MKLTYKTNKLKSLCENSKYNKELEKKGTMCKEITKKNKKLKVVLLLVIFHAYHHRRHNTEIEIVEVSKHYE